MGVEHVMSMYVQKCMRNMTHDNAPWHSVRIGVTGFPLAGAVLWARMLSCVDRAQLNAPCGDLQLPSLTISKGSVVVAVRRDDRALGSWMWTFPISSVIHGARECW